MLITLIILLVAVVLFATGKIRSDIVALCALAALLILQIITPEEGLSGFANSTVIMMAGLFIVGEGVLRTGLAKTISSKLLEFAGNSQTKLFLLVMLVTSLIGAFVSNTGTVALMLPIVVSLAKNAKMNPSRLLMPVAFASSMGGMMTLIGTPSNMIVSQALVSAGYKGLSFFTFLPTGIVCVVVGTVVLLPLTKLFLSKERKKSKDGAGKSLDQLVEECGAALLNGEESDPQDEGLYFYDVGIAETLLMPTSGLINKTVQDIGFRQKYNLNVLGIRRGKSYLSNDLADVKVRESDVMLVQGAWGDIGRLSREDNDFVVLGQPQRQAERVTVDRKAPLAAGILILMVVLMASIALQCAATLGLNPVPFVLAVSIGASMSFTSPFSTPPNALVMPAGQYTFMDFIKVGLPLQIIIGVVMVLVLPLVFPF